MDSARQQILARIPSRRSGLQAVVREYATGGTLSCDQRLDLFADRLHDYNATVYQCAESDIAQAIERAMRARQKRSLVVAAGFPQSYLPEVGEFPVDKGLSYPELDACEGVLTTCALAIAVTGTIVLQHSEANGRRALTLIPDYHLCIVHASQLVETVVEGIRALAGLGRLPVTTISGPSATSDIEMIRVKGVHGPRILDVLLAID